MGQAAKLVLPMEGWNDGDEDEAATFAGVQGEGGVGRDPWRANDGGVVGTHGVHATVIVGWKKQAIEGMAASFSGKGEATPAVSASGGDKAACQERSSDCGADIGIADGGRSARGRARFFAARVAGMSVAERRAMIDPAYRQAVDRAAVRAELSGFRVWPVG